MKSIFSLLVILFPLVSSCSTAGSRGEVLEVADALPGTLPIAEIRAQLADREAHAPFVPVAPVGLGDLADFIPAENPLTPAKVELGRQLYFDPRLSLDGTVSCATCHHPAKGWTDNLPASVGIDGQIGGRSAPTVVNRILGKSQFWDGRAATLEVQALGPIGNPIEMGFSPEKAAQRLSEIEGYQLQFRAVFGGGPTPDRIAKAIGAFERTVISGGSKNDYYEQALPFFDFEPEEDEDPEFLARMDRVLDLEAEHRMSEAAERGRELFFGKAQCSACHAGQDLSDEEFHNLGIGFESANPDKGREEYTGLEADRGKFRTPSVRNIALTAPYMHDGRLKSLMEVVEHYDKGGTPNPWLSDKVFPLNLSDREKKDLVLFMEEALTGTFPDIGIPRLP
jgi:cytochrome c peroxidase